MRLQARLQKQRELAGTDGLTGLPNRRSFDRTLKRELARAHRAKRGGGHGTISLALLDLDHFKSINDTYGHPLGDAILMLLGKLLRKNSRTSDFIARVGGEEFFIIMPDTHLEGAIGHLEILRKKIKKQVKVTVDGELVRVTASIGVVEMKENESGDEFRIRADDALYASKKTGRNRVVAGY